MFLPSSSIAFLFSPDFCLKAFDLTTRLLLFFISAFLASTLASLISFSAMACSCRFFFLDWYSSSSMHFLSFLVCSFLSSWEWYLCRAWVQDVSSSFDIESSIWPSCCLMPTYALRIAISESYCMLLLGCPCSLRILFQHMTAHVKKYLHILAPFQYAH